MLDDAAERAAGAAAPGLSGGKLGAACVTTRLVGAASAGHAGAKAIAQHQVCRLTEPSNFPSLHWGMALIGKFHRCVRLLSTSTGKHCEDRRT